MRYTRIVEILRILFRVISVVGDVSLVGFANNGVSNVSPQTAPANLVTGNISLTACLLLCEKNIQCMSIFIRAGQCHHFFKSFVDNSSLLPDPGWVYYNVYTGTSKCPYYNGYIESRHLNICYKLHSGGHVYIYDFIDTCASEGAALLRVSSQEIQDHITAFLTDAACHKRVIIQGSDRNNEGTFEFDDGSAMTYFNWNSGEPNNGIGGNEDFIALIPHLGGEWYDIDHTYPDKYASFICELDIN